MTTSEFIQLLQEPSHLQQVSYENLDQLLLQYPYCTGIRMLLLKKYKNDKHSAFERHLALASMYAVDRGKLYDFVNAAIVADSSATFPPVTKLATDKQVDNPALESAHHQADAPETELETDEDEEKKTLVEVELVAPPPVYHSKVSENPPMLAFQRPVVIELEEEGTEDADAISDLELEERSLSAMPIEEWLQDFEPPRINEKANNSPKKGFKLSRIPLFKEDMFSFLEEEDKSEKTPTPKAKKTRKKRKKKTPTTKKVKEPTPEPTELPKETSELEPVTETEKLVNEEVVPQNDKEFINLPQAETGDNAFENLEAVYEANEESSDVFDFFMTQTSGFLQSLEDKRAGVEQEKPAVDDWEDDSTDEDEEIISETLADLLVLQGQKGKAIKMYTTLSLKFPEKSRLFADKIAELS